MSLMRSPTKKIEDFCRTGSGGTPSRSKSEYFEAGTIPWVKSGELKARFVTNTEEAITDAAVKKSSVKLVPKGSLLIAMYGATVGEVSELAMDAATNQAICHIVPDPNVCDRGYLFQYLSSIKSELLDRRVGGGQPNISQAIIKSLEVPLPALSEQRRIAAILDKADALRAKRREAIAKLDQLLQSVFLEMFGDPLQNTHQYPLVSLADTVEQNRPITYGILMPGPDVADGIPYVRVVDIRGGKVITASVRRTSLEIAHAYRRSALLEGDILMSIRGHVGRVGVTPRELDGANITQDTARISVNKNFDSRYISGLLNTSAIQRHMKLFTRGAAVKGINLKDVREIPVPMPPKSQQLRYGEVIQKLNELQSTFTHQLEAADRIFFSLQSDVFSIGI